LPEPAASATGESEGPRTPVEEVLAGIWAEVLGVERVGVHESFFELGGHSLLATRVQSRVCEAFQVDVPLHTLFRAPTIADFAVAVAQLQVQQMMGDELADLLGELESLSEDDARVLLESR
ncbi:MAG TPA: phosphopantetheine-binding protein, partial [Longimicrobiaceae bacterium]|nr:phosphopantetheine-binding protein [Longimicrobiaceae bacterium]